MKNLEDELVEKVRSGSVSYSSAMEKIDSLNAPYDEVSIYLALSDCALESGDISSAQTLNKMARNANLRAKVLNDIDYLTGLGQRATFDKKYNEAHSMFVRHDVPFAVGILDIDDFKGINDNYGHLAGDAVLKKFADRLKEGIRDIDGVYRCGGDEFRLLYSGVDGEQALHAANNLRERALSSEIGICEDKNLNVAFSCGLYSVKEDDGVEDSLEKSDRALYVAKKDGKNKVVLYED